MRMCFVENCKRERQYREYCHMHKMRMVRHGTLDRLTKKSFRKILSRKSIEAMHKTRFGGLRDKVLKRDDYKCVNCGITNNEHLVKWGKSITVDHIDGNGRNSTNPNNKLENLQTLCVSCHGRKDSIKYWQERRVKTMDEYKKELAENIKGIAVLYANLVNDMREFLADPKQPENKKARVRVLLADLTGENEAVVDAYAQEVYSDLL